VKGVEHVQDTVYVNEYQKCHNETCCSLKLVILKYFRTKQKLLVRKQITRRPQKGSLMNLEIISLLKCAHMARKENKDFSW
jgi:hypothetical protein